MGALLTGAPSEAQVRGPVDAGVVADMETRVRESGPFDRLGAGSGARILLAQRVAALGGDGAGVEMR